MRKLIAMRIPEDLLHRVDKYATVNGWSAPELSAQGGNHGGKDHGRTALTVALYEALVEGRLSWSPAAGPNPFPAEEIEAGMSLAFPIPVWINPERVREDA